MGLGSPEVLDKSHTMKRGCGDNIPPEERKSDCYTHDSRTALQLHAAATKAEYLLPTDNTSPMELESPSANTRS